MPRWADVALGVLAGALLVGVALWVAAPPRGEPIVLLPPPPTSTPTSLVVDVVGAVRRPGVYTLPHGSRVRDAIAAAGGFLPSAVAEAINLAAFLEDGMRIFVPAAQMPTSVVRTPTVVPLTTATSSNALPRINVNTATAEELEALPRIGPALAQRIIAYRQAHGPFQKVDDLLAVKGIGPALLETIRPYVTTGE